MYNESLKINFIRDYTQSINTANVATTIFNAFEPYEIEWKSDLSTKSAGELQPVIDEIVGLRRKSQWMSLTVLKEYVKWCIAMNVPGACDGMLHITVAGLDKVKRQMVSGPVHLQRYLDELFDPESKETVDNLYRCYYWMAFSGIQEDETLSIKTTDIDFTEMTIRCGDNVFPLYRESLPAFHNAIELTEFSYIHPNYSKIIRRNRVPGETIMRGVKAVTKTLTIRSVLTHRSADALHRGKTKQQLSFYRVRISGLFYRMYERERAGIPVDFSDAAVKFMSGKTYTLNEKYKIEYKQNSVERDYMEDYQRWKLAFLM